MRYADAAVLLVDKMEELQATVNKVNDIGKAYSMKNTYQKDKANGHQ